MTDTIDSQDIGVLVLAEFSVSESEISGFMHAASPGKEVLTSEEGLTLEELQRLQEWFRGSPRPQPFTQFKFRDPHQYPIESLGVYWCKYWLPTKNFNLTLLRFTYASTSTFQLSDVEIPLRLAGCVLIINLKKFYQMKTLIVNQSKTPPLEDIELQKIWAGEMPRPEKMPSDEWIATEFKRLLNRERSATAKVKQAKLPFVVVPVEPYPPDYPSPVMSLKEMSDMLDLEPHIPVISCTLIFDNIGEGVNKEALFPFSREDVERVLSVLMEQVETEGVL
jgi:hypothetical protein